MEQIAQMVLEYGLLGAVALAAIRLAWIERQARIAAERRERKMLLSVAKITIASEKAAEYEALEAAAETKPVPPEMLAQALRELGEAEASNN